MKDRLINSFIAVLTGLVLVLTSTLRYAPSVLATPEPKVTICHATSSATNPYEQIVVSENAIGGHFDNPGTPKAGHEDDLLFEGEVDCPSPSPSVSPDPSPSSSPSPSPHDDEEDDDRDDESDETDDIDDEDGTDDENDDEEDNDNPQVYGSIRVCKVIVNPTNNIVNGSDVSGSTFTIAGISPSTFVESAIGQIPDSVFTTPLVLNVDFFGSDGIADTQCVTYANLAIGSYFYGQETINSSYGWQSPLYNDQFTQAVVSLVDFFTYDSVLFDADVANDDSRNRNADGHIVLTNDRPDRTLVVLNQYQVASTPPVGGPNVGVGGSQAPSCPVDGLPQKVEQVWFSDLVASQVTVHWVNKGDTSGYHIAYGTKPSEWQWGVEVGNVDQYTISDLPEGVDLWFTVIPLGVNKCPGGQSDPAHVGGQVLGAQVLGATGDGIWRYILILGFGFLAAGVCQLYYLRKATQA